MTEEDSCKLASVQKVDFFFAPYDGELSAPFDLKSGRGNIVSFLKYPENQRQILLKVRIDRISPVPEAFSAREAILLIMSGIRNLPGRKVVGVQIGMEHSRWDIRLRIKLRP